MTLGQGHGTPLGHGKQLVTKLWNGYDVTWTLIVGMRALWLWPRRYVPRSRSWHTLGSWTPIVWNIIQIQLDSEELWSRYGFWVCAHRDLDLGDMTYGQGHDTPWGYWKQLVTKLWHGYDATDRQRDRQKGWYSYIPPNFVWGGV